MLSVLQHLNYKPWFALAEFVDNSLQSAIASDKKLQALEGPLYKTRVEIDIEASEPGRIVIRDNAAGIPLADFPRAFRPAEVPLDREGLSEFGMGMKSAACWFAARWSVRTSALGEPFARRVEFEIDKIVNDRLEELEVEATPCDPDSHFTEIELLDLNYTPVGKTVSKIKEHLADIYRVFLRAGTLKLVVRGEDIQYEEPEVLVAPKFSPAHEASGEALEWRYNLEEFDFGDGLSARGFVALRKTGSTRYAGFSLFRRNRLIVGSGDEKYRPKQIFGNANDFEYQRIFGELHLEGFDVSHTKDGFQWDDNEEPFLELLREAISTDALDLLSQARNYRVRPTRKDRQRAAATSVSKTEEALKQHGEEALLAASEEAPDEASPPEALQPAEFSTSRDFDIDFEERRWKVTLELVDDPAVGSWLEVSDAESSDGREALHLRMALTHPFTERFGASDAVKLEPLVRIAAGLGLAEKVARDGGAKRAPAVRIKLSRILELALSKS